MLATKNLVVIWQFFTTIVDGSCHQHRDVTANNAENLILQFEKDNALQASFPSALIFNAANKNLAT